MPPNPATRTAHPARTLDLSMIYFLLRLPQIHTVDRLFTALLPTARTRVVKLPYRDLFASSEVPTGTYIFTGLDQLSRAQKLAAAQIAGRLCEAGSVVLNRPDASLDRFDLLSTLYEKGLNSFRAYRASSFADARPSFPVFVRSSAKHHGPLSPLLHSRSEVDDAVREAQRWGYSDDDLLVVEFCDVRDDDGYYRKYAAFRVADRIIPCHLNHSTHWSVKQQNRQAKAGAADLAAEELRFIEENPHETALMRFFEIAGIQYGRIDYAVKEGMPQVWEINTAPTIASNRRRADPARDRERLARSRAREIFYGSLDESLSALDVAVPSGSVAIWFDRDLLPQIEKDLVVERSVVRTKRLLQAARSIGMGRIGRLKRPVSRFVSRLLNRDIRTGH